MNVNVFGKQTSIYPIEHMYCMPALYMVLLKAVSSEIKRVMVPPEHTQEFIRFMKEQNCLWKSYLDDVYINLTSCKILPVKLSVPLK